MTDDGDGVLVRNEDGNFDTLGFGVWSIIVGNLDGLAIGIHIRAHP